MRTLIFAKRNFKEIVRDPISLIFCIALPIFLLVIFQQFKIPSEVYSIENFTPGIIIFSFSFITLFSSQLVSKDRCSSFLTRLFSSPLTPFNYIVGYSLALVPLALGQSVLFVFVASFLGLKITFNVLLMVLVGLFISFLFVALGILIGSKFNDKATPGVSSIVVQLVAFTSGLWFDTSMVSKFFQTVCNVLPFKHTLDLLKAIQNGNFTNLLTPILIVLAYTILAYVIAVIVFKRKMRN